MQQPRPILNITTRWTYNPLWEIPRNRFGGWIKETDRPKCRHRALVRPYLYVLEDAMETWLLNARHMHNVPGRKTDLLTELPGLPLQFSA